MVGLGQPLTVVRFLYRTVTEACLPIPLPLLSGCCTLQYQRNGIEELHSLGRADITYKVKDGLWSEALEVTESQLLRL
ncbi:hypothetical protein J4Q44_G00191010 [Coregonus suidteri]|uniref:Uncharacterized protein n=1 Tax=Coregonus suidteri TaxID=861788 RepID=A0AAN8QTX0_9TELE